MIQKLLTVWIFAVLTSTLSIVGWITYQKADPVLWFLFGLLVMGFCLFTYLLFEELAEKIK